MDSKHLFQYDQLDQYCDGYGSDGSSDQDALNEETFANAVSGDWVQGHEKFASLTESERPKKNAKDKENENFENEPLNYSDLISGLNDIKFESPDLEGTLQNITLDSITSHRRGRRLYERKSDSFLGELSCSPGGSIWAPPTLKELRPPSDFNKNGSVLSRKSLPSVIKDVNVSLDGVSIQPKFRTVEDIELELRRQQIQEKGMTLQELENKIATPSDPVSVPVKLPGFPDSPTTHEQLHPTLNQHSSFSSPNRPGVPNKQLPFRHHLSEIHRMPMMQKPNRTALLQALSQNTARLPPGVYPPHIMPHNVGPRALVTNSIQVHPNFNIEMNSQRLIRPGLNFIHHPNAPNLIMQAHMPQFNNMRMMNNTIVNSSYNVNNQQHKKIFNSNYHGERPRRDSEQTGRPRRDSEIEWEEWHRKREIDEYAGLMTPRDKAWLRNIQSMQLEENASQQNSYEMDYYYLMYNIKRQKKSENDVIEVNGLKMGLLDKGTNEISYKPPALEKSLGKLQVVSVNAPRKIIDMHVVHLDSSHPVTNLQKGMRKHRQLLMHVEKLYTVQLELDDLERKIRALPDCPTRDLFSTKCSNLVKEMWHELTNPPENLVQILCIRKGKTLASRFLNWLPHPDVDYFLATLIQNFAFLTKKDASDCKLDDFWPFADRFFSFSQVSVLATFAHMIAKQLEKLRSGPFSFVQNKLGLSILYRLLIRGGEVFKEIKSEKKWRLFISTICEALNSLREIDATSLAPLQSITMATSFSRTYEHVEEMAPFLNPDSPEAEDPNFETNTPEIENPEKNNAANSASIPIKIKPISKENVMAVVTLLKNVEKFLKDSGTDE